MRRFLFPLLLFTLCLAGAVAAAPVRAETLHGRVVGIVDGDTLRVEVAGRGQWQVRLAWIDAPARLQADGEAARSSLGALAAGRSVVLHNPQPIGADWLAQVYVAPADARCGNVDCPPTLDLGLAQLTRGMAWHDRRGAGQPSSLRADYEQAEFAAKIRRFGLWAGKNPLPPWEWRGAR